MKKAMLLLTSFLMICSMAGCSTPKKDEPTAATGMKAGTYTATSQGMNDVVEVTVEVSEDAIVSVKVTKDSETPGIGGVLKNAAGKELDEGGKAPTVLIPEEIVANQSLDVDTVTGATITSAAVINAVKDCLTQAGADPAITYVNKPHVGTDVLRTVVKNIRSEIESLGGEVRFGCRLEDFETQNGHLCSIRVSARKGTSEAGRTVEEIPASALVLAIGHSARDTFAMLAEKPLDMQAKAFAVGLRIQHPQTQINLSQYGREEAGNLGAASYKLTAQTSGGRGVYSFCMCPGGFVVDASSEPGRLAINGMSNHDRAGANANSALIVTVTPEDFPQPGTLGGVTFQRQLEEAAYRCGGGKIPVQLYGDFRENRISTGFGAVTPQFEGQFAFGNLREVLPEVLSAAMLEGMEHFGHVIHGFDREDAVFAGVESRTSSPLRIPRDHATMESSTIAGIYPCGEGAGYAGGITSAAMDGMKTAEAIIAKYAIPKIKL